MPPNRTDPAPPSEEPSDEGAPVPPPAAPGGFKPWLPLVITVLLMPALAYAMTTFVLVPRIQHALGIAPAPTGASDSHAPKSSHTDKKESFMMPKLLVNVAGTQGSRYLLVSLSIVGGDSNFEARMEAAEPRLRDMACGALETKTIAELEKPGARNLIRSELISGFNKILGGAVVQEIYLTEFAIQ
jgi:flagellar FliL protein